MGKAALYWDRRFARWPARSRSAHQRHPEDGYSLLMPVPGDLPVFLEIALRVCALQSSDHRVETIVIPDAPSSSVERLVSRASASWSGSLRVQNIPAPERWITPRLKNPFRNYSLQFYAGVRASRATHAVLHDSDLFLVDPTALDRQFERIRALDAACLGVSPAWDDWFRSHDLHPVATWELFFATEWARSFPPCKHMARDDVLQGETHTFDITLLTQALTDQRKIVQHEVDFVHFNHTIAAYRRFQARTGMFTDTNFRLLLVSLFIELFSADGSTYAVPSLRELGRNLVTPTDVRYVRDEAASQRYGAFRDGVARILDGIWVTDDERQRCIDALALFDDAYGWRSTTV